MNHDDKNSPPDMQPWIEPELEARVVAWVMGEASPFEIAELERLLREKPELAIFKRRIEAVHGLVGEAARPDREPLKLSAERRAKLLQAIGAPGAAGASVEASSGVQVMPGSRRRRVLPWIWAAAACLAIGGFVATSLQTASRRESSVALAVAQGAREKVETPERDDRRRADVALMAPEARAFRVPPELQTADLKKRLEAVREEAAADAVALPLVATKMSGRGGRGGGAGAAPRDLGAETNASALYFAGGDAARAAQGGAAGRPLLEPASPPPAEGGSFAGLAATASSPAQHFYGSALSEPPARAAADQSLAAAEPVLNPAANALELSPFNVSPDSARGYIAGNTISGTRLNSTLSDMAGGIAVVTKQQLADTPMVAGIDAYDANRPVAVQAGRARDDAPVSRPVEPAPKVEETTAAQEAVSTFSLHVGDVSFRLAQAALARGELPEAARIRPEEFYNAFDYGDPVPSLAEKVGARVEQAAHPALQQRNLVRVAFKVPAAGRLASQPLRLTVLLDTSGSMEREDRVAAVRRALAELVALLGPQDRVTLIGFARQPRLLAEAVPGNQAGMLVQLAARTPAEGGTNLEEALKLAAELARRHRLPAAQNRVVLLTDGAANLGNASPAQLAAAVEALRQQGIAFDACGVGLEGLDDGVLERLTRNGNGRYYALSSPEVADAGFARQLAGAFRPAAENVKVQVRFNPARVGRYRLIGFDRHRLAEQDFRNDAVDAAELAAEEAAVALYEVEVLPQGSGEVGELFVRFRDAATGAMVERSWTIAHEPRTPAFDRAAPALQLAGVSALLAEKLRQSPVAAQFKLGDLVPVMNALRGHYAQQPRVGELAAMFDQARRLGRD